MLVQKPFKRLKVNAGFTFNHDCSLCVKVSNSEYIVSGATHGNGPSKTDKNQLVWVDSAQVKRWFEW
ncbi:hypothetical protein PP425_gp066 [Enterobacter phage vB_EclM_Q7622]|jgi:hypothetical protein|uniref:hypothetical protein n=1 Tax=Enterobacter phage vB_EclM_Q7622 TaxID=2908628 RepID=UPI00232998C2|nr:hypothetical protein PP425_gp066 [Enterobacter phage vB_EclM_Q7622]UIS65581.1 hypothetical protein Q76222_00066 [Enterobacter phage vB_EclM_Q7622]